MAGLLEPIRLASLLAIGASIANAVVLVSVRQGMRSASPLAAALVLNVIVSVSGLAAAAFRGTLQASSLVPLLWFAAAGAIALGLGRILFYIGIERMGVTRSTPIQASTPIWGVFFAAAVLEERPGFLVWAGTAGIVAGVSLFTWGEEAAGRGPREGFRGALILLVSSLMFAVAPILVKFAYAHQATPIVGMGVGYGVGSLVLLAGKPLLPERGKIRLDRRSLGWYALAGSVNVACSVMILTAFVIGDVSVILPLSRMYPLWVVVLSYLFLGRLERITRRVVLAAALVVAGGALITAAG
jgi:drug/metabolite transporter (DMT)-like permease